MNTILQDQNGNMSSKRLAGYIGFGVSVGLAVVALMWADNAEIAVDLVKSFLTFSAGLLGLGVVEFFKK